MPKPALKALQNTLRNNLTPAKMDAGRLSAWLEAYFEFEVTTLKSSREVQRRDLNLFLTFMSEEVGSDRCELWSPRLSAAFKSALQKAVTSDGGRRWNDRTVNRILAHVKTFAKWVHKHRPFPLGELTAKLKLAPTSSLLAVERALGDTERRRILDAADLLLETGGRSKDRHRFREQETRPKRRGYRPYRNRAIVYTLIETGMRRSAVTRINVKDMDRDKRVIRTEEKGSVENEYTISREGLEAILAYLKEERPADAKHFNRAPALFLPACTVPGADGRLRPKSINDIWNEVCETAGVKGKTPHAARHAMGRHLIKKTGNPAAVQRQLGHRNASYSMQYMRVTQEALDERE